LLVCVAGIWIGGLHAGGIVNYKNYENGKSDCVIEIARKEIGVREAGCENCGRRVEAYLGYVGFRKAAPWCAAFVSWVFGQAGFDRPRTAWSPALFPSSRLIKQVFPGSLAGIYFSSLKRIGHCGIVESMRKDWYTLIEGNTNVAGNREGDGVYRRIRHKRTISRYADWLSFTLKKE